MDSYRYSLNKADAIKIGKALLYSGLSATATTALVLLPNIDIPVKWIWLVPVINVGLVTLKEFFSGKTQ